MEGHSDCGNRSAMASSSGAGELDVGRWARTRWIACEVGAGRGVAAVEAPAAAEGASTSAMEEID